MEREMVYSSERLNWLSVRVGKEHTVEEGRKDSTETDGSALRKMPEPTVGTACLDVLRSRRKKTSLRLSFRERRGG
jgi:hypothetical protein